jgi:hypothetical protein
LAEALVQLDWIVFEQFALAIAIAALFLDTFWIAFAVAFTNAEFVVFSVD